MSTAPSVSAIPRAAVPDDGSCTVCPHALSGHDRISLRFCQATQATATTRGCVCPA